MLTINQYINNAQGKIYTQIDDLNMIILPPSARLTWHNHTKDGGAGGNKTVLVVRGNSFMVEMTKLCSKNWPYFRDHYQYIKGHC